ncbi:MAG: monofunctional biosynthetic peptidoglycan transglycosylase [Candidatus Latescibacterota bacterium]|nr:MAG: monofunctional biosynthetic peptidoglycan transglycosylase [Candidatus Latescibacterota bacterium]
MSRTGGSSGRAREAERRSRGRVLFVAVLLALAAVFLSPIGYLTAFGPNVGALVDSNPQTTAVMQERADEAVREGRPFRREQRWVPLGKISPHLVRAVLVNEDAAFYAHKGFDVHEIKEAIRKDWKEKRFARGASTITQQLAKNLYFGTEKSLRRKLLEAITAWRIERTLSKDRILEIYLNVIEWGDGVYGAEAASRRYFGVGAGELAPREAALLASSIPSPRRMNPADPGPYLRERAEITLRRMGAVTPTPTAPSRAGAR